jgi:hypothetical protein
MVLFGALAAANGVATFVVQRKMRIAKLQLSLPGTGTGAGNTTVAVKLNGNLISPTGGISIAGAAVGKTAAVDVTKGSQAHPGGALAMPGDVITVDVTAVPATTVPAGGVVYLDVLQLDI